jgi:hypothetical protein
MTLICSKTLPLPLIPWSHLFTVVLLAVIFHCIFPATDFQSLLYGLQSPSRLPYHSSLDLLLVLGPD